ncbi:retrovirus-related pol polyprotein from transposon TNT 1-94 [Tanacetum coccineum]
MSNDNRHRVMRVIRCYNCRGEGHIARQCTQPKRVQNSEWFKEKIQLAQAQEAGVALDEEHIAFLANKGERVDSGTTAQKLKTNVIFQTDGIDAFDSDCDEASTASVVFMANLCFGSDVLSEVPTYNTYHDNIVFEQNVQEMQYFEQHVIDDDSNIKITSDSNFISYDQYLKESEIEVVQSIASPDQQNAMIMSVIEKMSSQTNIDLTDREKYIDGQMRGVIVDRNAKFADFQNQIQTLKLQLSAYVESHKTLSTAIDVLKKENKEKQEKYIKEIIDLEKKKKALENIVYKQVKKHDVLSVMDAEETLMLAEESRLKMNAKQNDPVAKEKKVNIAPINYVALNKLSEHFIKHFVPKKQLSVEQSFWLPISKTVSEKPSVQPEPVQKDIPQRKYFEIEKKELFIENDRHLEHIICQDVMCIAMHADFENNCVLLANDNNLAYAEMEQSYIYEYSRCLELEDAREFRKFFEINELKAQLQAKNTRISNLKNHIKELKEKSVADCIESVTKSKVIALGMFKLDLEPLSPKLKKNREAHVNYLKTTKDNADILRDIVEQARTSNPSNDAVEYACMYAKQIQELLVYVSDKCPISRSNSEKLVAI